MPEQITSTHVAKILVVEDEQVVAMDLQQSLASLGYEVAGVAETGRRAVRLAEETFPDLVLMDVRLQGAMDGIQAADEIRRRWQIPVIYTTAFSNEETLERAKATGPFGYLVKPFHAHELHASIAMALQQHRLSQEILENRSWLTTILASIRDGVIATDAVGQIRLLNPAAEQLTGWYQSEAIGNPIEHVYRLLAIDRRPVEQCLLKRALATGKAQGRVRAILLGRGGSEIPIEDAATPIRDAQGEVKGALTIFFDITERMRVERIQMEERNRLEEQVAQTTEALGSTRTELRALANRLITAQEEFRRRLALDLHDDASQRLAFLQFEAERLQPLSIKAEVRVGLQRISQEAENLSANLRDLSHRLHPSVLEHLGLPAALRTLVEDYRAQGLHVTLSTGDETGPVSQEVGTSLYRIAQEALRNVLKHAPQAAVYIRLREEAQQMQLIIEDSGPGFDINQARAEGGLGLLSMQERARLAGGTLLLSSRPDTGTTLVARVPSKRGG